MKINLDNLDISMDEEIVQDLEVETQEEEIQEEQEETEEQEDSTEETNEEPETDVDESLAKIAYDKYVEQGLIDADEEFDGKFETLETMLEDLPTKVLRQAIQELAPESQSLLQYVSTGGSNLTKKDLINFVKTWEQEDRTEFKDDDFIDARTYIETKLKEKGLRPKAIQAELDELEDSEELITEANKYLKEDNTKTQKLIQQKEQENKQIKESQRQFISSINEELKSFGWSNKKVNDVKSAMPNANKILQNIYNSPKAYVQLIDILTKFNGKEFDFSSFEKQAETKAISSIKTVMNKASINSASNTKTNTGSPLEKGDWAPVLED